jgi:hypothetical protein
MRLATKEGGMSTDYRLAKDDVTFAEIIDGRLEKRGIKVNNDEDAGTNDKRQRLYDGKNYVWVYDGERGPGLVCYGVNDPDFILNAIADAFDTAIHSEHDPEFWGQ